jgi:hypothetical protein
MKAEDVIIYTVGFQIPSGSSAETLVNNCATDSAHVYLPATGTALQTAFAAIGADIAAMRISK